MIATCILYILQMCGVASNCLQEGGDRITRGGRHTTRYPICQDLVFFEKCPIQLIVIIIVDVGTIVFQLKSIVIASIECIF